ncbi:hypothetical protein FQR65_LT12221 [Abscondita terminalis]|nr:hypothetical protein FQR65_LT12221 [Abscondita terminalis]
MFRVRFLFVTLVSVTTIVSLINIYFISGFFHRNEKHESIRIPKEKPHWDQTGELLKASETLPSLPLKYWNENSKRRMEFNKTCAKFPSPFNVDYHNLYWQHFGSSRGNYYLYNAYLDDRVGNRLGPTVRILGMMDEIEPIKLMRCQLWFRDKRKPVIVTASAYDLIWLKGWGQYKKGNFLPYLIPCRIPSAYRNLTVEAVSLVENECDNATNVLKVIDNKPIGKKQDFAVCVKGMDFLLDDISSILIEWIEVLHLLGADKIFFYNLHVHENVKKVIDHYQNLGRLKVEPLTLAVGPNTPYLQHMYLKENIHKKRFSELIPYNDCFYKHMHEYKYITLLDVDEIIVPLIYDSWKNLTDLKNDYDAFYSRHVYYIADSKHTHKFFDDIPEYMHILNYVNRDRKILKSGVRVKTFFNTETAVALHNHFPLKCLRHCKSKTMNPTDVRVQHYRITSDESYAKFLNISVDDGDLLEDHRK